MLEAVAFTILIICTLINLMVIREILVRMKANEKLMVKMTQAIILFIEHEENEKKRLVTQRRTISTEL